MIRKKRELCLKPYNTFGIEAKCQLFVEFDSVDELQTLFSSQELDGKPWFVLGGGSNVLFSKDFEGVVLHPTNQDIEVVGEFGDKVKVRAGAGVEWDDFVAWCVERGYWGVENLSDIPGSVGAAPVQNIGAYGVEVKDTIESVETFAVSSKTLLTLAGEHCDFGYRQSIFKNELKGKVIITSVNFLLSLTPNPSIGYGDLRSKVEELGGATIDNVRRAVIEIRDGKLPCPSELGSAGSFFKNPFVDDEFAKSLKDKHPTMPLYPSGVEGKSKLAAGWLIDQCGWKGHREGNVGVHERQALVLVNYGGATGGEVLALAESIRADVKSRFGVELEMEVNVL